MLSRILCFPFFINWSDFKNNISKFTTTTGLLLQCLAMFNSFLESFFISNLRCTLIYFNFKLTAHTIHNNLQVKFSHAT